MNRTKVLFVIWSPVPTYEMVVHLAKDEKDFVGNYDEEFEAACDFNIRRGPLEKKREKELQFLLERFY